MLRSIPIYKIYAVKYAGPFLRPLARVLWNKGWEDRIEISYYIWVIQGNGETVMVDSGVAPSLAREQQLEGYVNPVHVLARLGIQASQVKRVILTHAHWDHITGIELFPNATFYLQKKEFDFWMRDPIAKKPPFLMVSHPLVFSSISGLEETGRLVLADGDHQYLPGVELLFAPGHTPGLQAVSVNTARVTAIVGSDCAHIFRSYEEEIPSCFITDMIAWMESYDKLKSRVSSLDLLFPGHDMKMSTHYPKMAEDITQLA